MTLKLFLSIVLLFIFVDSYLSSKPGANTVHHKITSWNLGLEAGVSMEKVDELFNQIPRNRDVVFVQEAWQLETRIIDRMKAHYPYSYHVENDRGRIVGSTLTSLFYLQRVALCAAENNQTRIYWDTVKTCLGDFNPWVKSELDGMKCIFSEQNNGNQNFGTRLRQLSEGGETGSGGRRRGGCRGGYREGQRYHKDRQIRRFRHAGGGRERQGKVRGEDPKKGGDSGLAW